jgi:aspartyl-tRNA(Asn)/glutamyl-tRNA(Gln) amidotransferase subunit A
VELTRAYLERIDALDGRLKCYLTLLAESALEDARAAEAEISRGSYRGPMHGIPIALKDLFDTRGVKTTGQSLAFKDRVPDDDATVAARLREAGAVLLGKLNMWELAIGVPPSLGEEPRNPWNLDHIPGGSSSGSGAAVAAGLCTGALGSDTGGSVRQPAALCGIVALLPSYGRLSRYGVMPLSWSLDAAGPMTRTVVDTALMLQAMAGHDPKDATSSTEPVPDYMSSFTGDIRGIKVGVMRRYYTQHPGGPVSPEAVASVDVALNTLEELGARVEDVDIPGLEEIDVAIGATVYLSEAFAYYQDRLRSQPQDFGEGVRRYLYAGSLLSGADYVQAQRARSWLRRRMAELFQRVDVLALPTEPGPAVAYADVDPHVLAKGPKLMATFNSIGAPAISVPCGFSHTGLPLGFQIAGRPFDEPTVLRVAHCYQSNTRFNERRPPL